MLNQVVGTLSLNPPPSVSLCHCWHAIVIVVLVLVLVLVIFYSSNLSGHAPVPVLDPAALAFDETLGFMLVT